MSLKPTDEWHLNTWAILASVTAEDWALAKALGASGDEVLAFAIHRALDNIGVPREGRAVRVSLQAFIARGGSLAEYIEIDLPPGWAIWAA